MSASGARGTIPRPRDRVRQGGSPQRRPGNSEGELGDLSQKATKLSPDSTPVNEKACEFSIGIVPEFGCSNGTDMGHCIQIQLPVEKGSEPPLFRRQCGVAARRARVRRV